MKVHALRVCSLLKKKFERKVLITENTVFLQM